MQAEHMVYYKDRCKEDNIRLGETLPLDAE